MLTHIMEQMIPITAIFMGIVCAIVAMYFRTKRQKEEQETLRVAMEKGVELPEGLLRRVDSGSGCDYHSRSHPLRRGILWTMVGLSLIVALWVSEGIEHAVWGGIPLAIGIGSLLFYAIAPKDESGKRTDVS